MSSASESPSKQAASEGEAPPWITSALENCNKLNEIELLARRHCSPASNPGAHALAAKIIQIIERPSNA